MNRLALVGTAVAGLLVVGLLGLSVVRVRALMARELDREGAATTLAAGTDAILVETDLLVGDHVTFELCSNDAMDDERWIGAVMLGVDAGATEPRESVLSEPIDGEMLRGARRGASGACLDFASAGPLHVAGHYVVVARSVTPVLTGVEVRARIVAEQPLTAGDRNFVLGILLAAIGLVIALSLRVPTTTEASSQTWPAARAGLLGGVIALVGIGLTVLDPRLPLAVKVALSLLALVACGGSIVGLRRGWTGAGAILGVLAVIELSTILSVITPPGPAFGLLAGLALAVSEVVIAVALARTFAARSGTVGALALQRPTRAIVAVVGFGLAPFVGIALRVAATRVLSWVPSTGQAPIETYVSWPSGLLSFAALSAIAPIGEEIFFRGLVYGALRGEGGRSREVLAFLGAWWLFVAAHLPQTWGSWGGLAAVAVAGLGFTTLRAVTGSVLVAAFAHLVYNGLLVVAALSAG